jgi:hypothetical protein
MGLEMRVKILLMNMLKKIKELFQLTKKIKVQQQLEIREFKRHMAIILGL